MKYILTAIMAMMISTTAFAEGSNPAKGHNVPSESVAWFVSTPVANAPGPSGKIKPYGDDLTVINPHIKDWYVNVELKDAAGNVTGFNQVYSHSIVRFTDANGKTFNISFIRVPVVN